MSQLLNFMLYQAGWFASVCGIAFNRPVLGMVVASGLIAVHVMLCRNRITELKLLAFAGMLGLMLESFHLSVGVYHFTSGQWFSHAAPPAVIVMWIQFATLLNFCLRWLSGRPLLSAVLGMVGGPLAFFAGERLGAVSFLPPRPWQFFVLGFSWAVAMPLMVWFADRLRRASTANAYVWELAGHPLS